MSEVRVQFLGSGDSFGSGGRLQSCVLVEGPRFKALLDCGASSLIALRKYQVVYDDIDLIFVTNFHGDHFGGIPYLVIDAQLNHKRTRPLVICGPEGIKAKFIEVMEATFSGSSKTKLKFPLDIVELKAGLPMHFGEVLVQPFPVINAQGDPHLALRLQCGGKIIAYSGDTEWTESLIPLASGADLLIMEAYFFEKKMKYHLDYHTISDTASLLKAKELVITHMSEDMLARLNEVACSYAQDGKVFEL